VPTISRDELYEQVWSRPMTKVAAEYGVTSTALKKTCNRHKIPTPERGYWAKLEHHKPVRRVSLPKLTDTRLDRVHITGGTSQRLPVQVSKAGIDARERLMKAPGPAAATDSGMEEPSILRATRRAISKARPDTQGFALAQGHGICLSEDRTRLDRPGAPTSEPPFCPCRNRGILPQDHRDRSRSRRRRRDDSLWS